jgi:hypothetical protein
MSRTELTTNKRSNKTVKKEKSSTECGEKERIIMVNIINPPMENQRSCLEMLLQTINKVVVTFFPTVEC